MINFPRMHVAQSVVNRILNTADEIDAAAEVAALPPPQDAPDAPDPLMEGAALDMKLMQPIPAVGELPEQPGSTTPQAQVAEAALSGDTALDGLLGGIAGPT